MYTWWTQKLSLENRAMLLVDRNKQLSMTKTFSVFFKHLFVVIVISTIPHSNTTMVSFYILQVEGGVLCKEIDVFYGNWYHESNNFRIERWRRAEWCIIRGKSDPVLAGYMLFVREKSMIIKNYCPQRSPSSHQGKQCRRHHRNRGQSVDLHCKHKNFIVDQNNWILSSQTVNSC